MSPTSQPQPSELQPQALSKIATILLVAAVLAWVGLVFCAVGWWQASHRSVELDALTTEDRQKLVATMLQTSPGTHRWSFFEPRLGYTLRPGEALDIWNDQFTSNGLGFRTSDAKKMPGTFRIVFVGDSWTYGMGVRRLESFPEVLAQLANEHAGLNRRVEAWTLALPGYNLHNSLAGLDFFFHLLEPDAVVVVPSGNDNHSSNTVLPNGAQWSDGVLRDEFGEPHQLVYRARRLDTFRFQERWRRAFTRLRQTEKRLQQHEVPLFLFFLARWQTIDAHHHISEAAIESPYAVVPVEWTFDPWVHPPPIGHGTADAQQLYARLLYRGLARQLGWQDLPAQLAGEVSTPTGRILIKDSFLFEGPPPPASWRPAYKQALEDSTRRLIPSDFRPPDVQLAQVAGPIDPQSGILRRAATVLIRPALAHRHLEVHVRPLEDISFIYPMNLSVHLPSANGGTSASLEITAEPITQKLRLSLPQNPERHLALDVVLQAERSASAPQVLANRSLVIEAVFTTP